jgi:DNA-binding CsgD family transcriptional regulator
MKAFNQEDYVANLRALRALPPLEDFLSPLKVPILVLHPSENAVGSEAKSLAIAQLTRGRLTIIDGNSVLGEAGQGVRAIEAFLAEIEQMEPQVVDSDVGLSPRELEVLMLIAQGCSNARIAEQLVISPNTVGRHVSNIFDKVGAANRVEAAAYARDHGLL